MHVCIHYHVLFTNTAVMTDEALDAIAARVTSSEDQLSRNLGLDPEAINRSQQDRNHVVRNFLCEWRESLRAIDLGLRALEALKTICNV